MVFKKLIRKMANRCGYEILNQPRLHRHAVELLQANAELERVNHELTRTKDDYESRLAKKVLELERAKGAYRDAHALLLQTQKAFNTGIGRKARPDEQPDARGGKPELDAQANVVRGRELQRQGQVEEALVHYRAALDLIHGYGPARQQLMQLSGQFWQQGQALEASGDRPKAKPCYVKAVELDPTNQQARADLHAVLQAEGHRDVTKQCFVYPDPSRGEQVYREAFLRALEYVAVAGVLGEVLEFGVLGGFTARILCETMRDLFVLKQIHLFDSFDGLPEFTSPVDANSYDIAGRKLWADKMRFPDSFVQDLGEPIDHHIFSRLCDVLSPERIFVYRGFFADTLQKPLGLKAALIHVDCDLYQSTKEVLTRLFDTDVLQDGCVLMFDDYNCFKASPYYGERRAFREFLEGQARFEATPFFSYGFNGAAFFLHERPG
jgi:O-methyltransferase